MATAKNLSVLALIVLYRTRPTEARTLQTLRRALATEGQLRVLVLDHSPQSQEDDFLKATQGWDVATTYVHDPRNPPLGAAYNAALKKHLGDADYALILDQDTEIPAEFLRCGVEAAMTHGQPSTLAPNIMASGRLASPCRLWWGWGRAWPSPRTGWLSLTENALINSGSWIHRRVFHEFGIWYDESLKLYGIDTEFFLRLSKRDDRCRMLDMVLHHELSFDAASVADKARKVNAMLAANRTIYRAEPWSTKLGVRLMSGLVRLRYVLQYRSLLFLR